VSAPAGFRCADAARERLDPVHATAPPSDRLFLVEEPGPWGRTALTDSRLDRYASGRLADRAQAAGVRVLLVRRPARRGRPPTGAVRRWALADTRPGHEVVHWGSWGHEHELLEVDLEAPARRAEPNGPQQLALVCAHGRHDVCCALRGRPVAFALEASAPGWDVWECSHLGGDRFAANVLLVPTGDLFGSLDPVTAVAAVRAHDDGRLLLGHHRGRIGRSMVEQAALHHAALALDEDGREALRVLHVTGAGDVWTVDVAAAGRRYRVRVAGHWSAPAHLTCAAGHPERVRRFDLTSIEDAGPVPG
jgi:hypothetical protein